jgi:RNA polymerase sigma-70 factor (ECF subfamily)
MSEATDVPDELVALAMAGDRRAVERVLATIRPLVVRYCRARLGRMDRSSVSADDVAQEVCLAVLTALPGYRVQGRPFLAFVYGIASHKVIDAHRAATRNRSEPVADVPDALDGSDGPEQRALRGELSGQMARLLDQLPEKQREIIVLRVVVGLSPEETADIVGSTPGAVRVAQHRALARLRRKVPKNFKGNGFETAGGPTGDPHGGTELRRAAW